MLELQGASEGIDHGTGGPIIRGLFCSNYNLIYDVDENQIIAVLR